MGAVRNHFAISSGTAIIAFAWSLFFQIPVFANTVCSQLKPHSGPTVTVKPIDNLPQLVSKADPGTEFLLLEGVYPVREIIQIKADGIRIRSKSGERQKVILDGNHGGQPLVRDNMTPEIFSVKASNITIANITIRYARDHAIHFAAPASRDIENVMVHNVHIYDCGQQLIKVNSNGIEGRDHWVDKGIVECSLLEFKNTSVMQYLPDNDSYYTGGIDVHGGDGWIIRGNTFRNIWRENKSMEHAVHMWNKCRNTVVENNWFIDNWRAIGFGMLTSPSPRFQRRFADETKRDHYFDHIGGVIRNNVIFNTEGKRLETGVELMNVIDTEVYHNTVVSVDTPFNSMEYRWPETRVKMKNNLCSHQIMARNGAQAELEANITYAPKALFVNWYLGDIHLHPLSVMALNRGASLPLEKSGRDIDGDTRDSLPDIGADEMVGITSLNPNPGKQTPPDNDPSKRPDHFAFPEFFDLKGKKLQFESEKDLK